jgi:UTP--glucose-1-phosphate uridylyltransferase
VSQFAKVKKAVIPAAGYGTRFLPATKAIPKEMAFILHKPALQWIVEEAVSAGVEEVIIVTSADKTAIQDHFRPRPALLQTLRQKNNAAAVAEMEALERLGERVRFVFQEEQLGLGHAILCAAEAVGDESFLVLLGDALIQSEVPCSRQLVQAHSDMDGASVIGLQTVPRERVHRYGIVAGEAVSPRLYQLTELVEKPSAEEAPSNLAIAGRYLLSAKIFEELRHTAPGKGGEIQLTDALQALVRKESVCGYVYEGRRLDIGNPHGYLEALLAYAQTDPAYDELLNHLEG